MNNEKEWYEESSAEFVSGFTEESQVHHQQALNTELAQLARDVIQEMREEGWEEQDIFWSTCGGLLKQCEAQGTIGDEPSKYDMAALQVLVKHVMKEEGVPPEPPLHDCPYCGHMHQAWQIDQCPLKPKHTL